MKSTDVLSIVLEHNMKLSASAWLQLMLHFCSRSTELSSLSTLVKKEQSFGDRLKCKPGDDLSVIQFRNKCNKKKKKCHTENLARVVRWH